MSPSRPLQICNHCGAEYDPSYTEFHAEWCNCEHSAQAVICPGCLSCTCEAQDVARVA